MFLKNPYIKIDDIMPYFSDLETLFIFALCSLYYVTALALIIIPGGEQEFPEHEVISNPCKTKGSRKRTSH